MKDLKDSKSKTSFKNFWLPFFITGIALIVFYKTVDKLPSVFAAIGHFIGILTPILLGIAIAFFLYKPVKKIEGLLKKSKIKFLNKSSRGISVLICYLVLFAAIGIILYLILPKIVLSIVNLVDSAPKYYASLMDFITKQAGADGKLFGIEVESIKSFFNLQKIISYFDFSTITKYAGEIFKATGVIVDFFLAIVISVYLLMGKEHLISVIGRLMRCVLPKEKVMNIRRIIFNSSKIFYSYIYSQMIDAVIVAAICTIAFSIARIPYAFLLAVLMGICNLVPYFGAIIGGFGVVFTTLISTGDFIKAIIALVLVVGAQQLDANIIQPRIVADSVGIKPIYVLIAISIGSGLFGFLGIILAVPVVAIIRMLILESVSEIEQKRNIELNSVNDNKSTE